MLNEELMNPLEQEVCRCKIKIKEFMEYDKERKKYVQKLQDELEEYSQKYLDLKHTLDNNEQGKIIISLKEKVERQRQELDRLNTMVSLIPPEELDRIEKVLKETDGVKTIEKLRKLQRENTNLRKRIENLRKANTQLAAQVSKLTKQQSNI